MSNYFISWLTKAIFVALFLSYIFFSLAEEFQEGFVSDYFSLNWLLVAVLMSATLFFVFQEHYGAQERKQSKSVFLIFISGLAALIVVWFGAREFELFWRITLSLFGGLMTVGILLVLFEE